MIEIFRYVKTDQKYLKVSIQKHIQYQKKTNTPQNMSVEYTFPIVSSKKIFRI